MAKGDSVKVYLKGLPEPIKVEAFKAGRKLETEFDKDGAAQWFLVHEKTWTDRTMNTTRFAVTEIAAIVLDLTEDK